MKSISCQSYFQKIRKEVIVSILDKLKEDHDKVRELLKKVEEIIEKYSKVNEEQEKKLMEKL